MSGPLSLTITLAGQVQLQRIMAHGFEMRRLNVVVGSQGMDKCLVERGMYSQSSVTFAIFEI